MVVLMVTDIVMVVVILVFLLITANTRSFSFNSHPICSPFQRKDESL